MTKSQQRRQFLDRSLSKSPIINNEDATSIYDENYWQKQTEQLMTDKKSNLKDIHELRQ